MHLSSSVLFLAVSLFIPTAWATVHTACYNEVKRIKGCVYSAADDRTRCDADATLPFQPVPLFELKKENESVPHPYHSPIASFYVLGGDGICGNYVSNEEPGACLWSGKSDSGKKPKDAGWLNGAKRSNCNKRLYVRRTGRPETTQWVTVKDGCGFGTHNVTIGCYQIALTNKTFQAFNPTPKEQAQKALESLSWDFDNSHGTSPQQAPV